MDLFTILEPWKYHQRIVQNCDNLDKLVTTLLTTNTIAVDTETSSLDIPTLRLAGIGIATPDNGSWYIPVGHLIDHPQLKLSAVINKLKPIFDDPTKTVVFHNAKFDMNVLMRFGITFNCKIADTVIMSRLIQERRSNRLKDLSIEHFGITLTPLRSIVPDENATKGSITTVGKYCRMDAKVTLLLYNKFIEIIEKEKLDRALRLEMELLPVVIAMENEGAYIDEDKLQELDIIISTKLDELNKSIIDKAGIEFNIDSTKQLIIILKDRFKLNPETKTQTGKESTNSEALNIMLAKNPSLSIVEDILEYRKYKKLKTTYIDSIKEKIKDGKIHATFKQLGADTGRFSSADPNMQNIPRVGEEDTLKVRNVFYAPYGYLLIVADYNQIELRVLAHFCQDTNLMEAFKGRKDVHKSTASMMFGIPISEVTKDQRFLAKALNFGLVYGMSEYGLARRIGKMDDLNYAKDLMDTYFNTYSGIKPWSHTMVMQAREVGYVRTLTGRRRHIINLDNDDLGLRKAAERRVSNTIIQGSAADIIKGAMIKLFSNKHLTSMGCKILLQVHDELVFMCPEEHVDECLPIIENIMEHPFKKDLRLPVSVAIGTAKYWGDAK